MSTIVELIERIEADRRAMLANPHMQHITSAIDEAARTQRQLLEGLKVPPMIQQVAENLRALREDLLRRQEAHERAERFIESLKAPARPVLPPARHDYIDPMWLTFPKDPHIHVRRQQEPEPLPKRTIVRPEVKRKIGFSKNGFRLKD